MLKGETERPDREVSAADLSPFNLHLSTFPASASTDALTEIAGRLAEASFETA
jgi:hypothetical protein